MVDTLSKIIFNFPGAANRARCTAHIINLVSKMILRQFDAGKKPNGSKKKSENANEDVNEDANDNNANDNNENNNSANDNHDIANEEANITELGNVVDDEDDLTGYAEELDREEQEVVDNEDDEMSEDVAADLEDIEEALKEEVSEVAKKVKLIQRVLFKVRSIKSITCSLIYYLWSLSSFPLSSEN